MNWKWLAQLLGVFFVLSGLLVVIVVTSVGVCLLAGMSLR